MLSITPDCINILSDEFESCPLDDDELSFERVSPAEAPAISHNVMDEFHTENIIEQFYVDDDQEFLSAVNSTIDDDQECLSAVNSTLDNTISQIRKLQNQLDKLYDMVGVPQVIHIKNFSQLKIPTGITSINDKVNTLFFDAHIPSNWKISIARDSTDSTCNLVDTVTVIMLNYFVKEKTKELLRGYFETNYDNIVYIE
jgi:hypothetical protein